MTARELQLLSVWHMKDRSPKRKLPLVEEPTGIEKAEVAARAAKAAVAAVAAAAYDSDDSDVATQVLEQEEEQEEEEDSPEYKVSSIQRPFLSGSRHLFCEEITWEPTWEQYEDLPADWRRDHRIIADDPKRQCAKVAWPSSTNVSVESTIHAYPGSISAGLLDAAWREASGSNEFSNQKYSVFDKTGPEKARSNRNFAEAVGALSTSGKVVFLDERDANTARCLQPVVQETDLQLVAVNIDPVVLSNAVILGGPNLTTFSGPLAAYLVNCTRHSISAIFADYCCTFAGNSNGLSPAHIDLPLLFGKGLLQDGAVFAMVVCTRFGPVKKKIMKQDIVPFIAALAQRHQYRTEITHSFSYGSMFSIQMKVFII